MTAGQIDLNVECEVLERAPTDAALLTAWRELAELSQRPYCLPAWLLTWFETRAEPAALLRIFVMRRRRDVLGIAPFMATRSRAGFWVYRLLGSNFAAPVEPLCLPGHEASVVQRLAAALADASPPPDVVSFEGTSAAPFPQRLAAAWTGGYVPEVHSDYLRAAPLVRLSSGDLEQWLATRSSNFRHQMRRRQRQLQAQGVRARWTDDAARLPADLEAFFRLHHARWRARGGSSVLTAHADAMLRRAAVALLRTGHLRLLALETRGEIIASHLFVRAGRRLAYFLGGFSSAFGRFQPTQVALVHAIDTALREGCSELDLGYGMQPYKARFSTVSEPLVWTTLLPRGPGYIRRRAVYTPGFLVRGMLEQLSSVNRDRVQLVRKRLLSPYLSTRQPQGLDEGPR